jgi:hypothetical protein
VDDRKLGDQFIAAGNWKPPLSPKAFVPTVFTIKHHYVAIDRFFIQEYRDKLPQNSSKQAFKELRG